MKYGLSKEVYEKLVSENPEFKKELMKLASI